MALPHVQPLNTVSLTSPFRIVGETREAVQQARNKLEYSELIIEVERDIACQFNFC